MILKKTVLIMFGGKSSEHDISLRSVASVLSAIDYEKYDVLKIGITKEGEWFETDSAPDEIRAGEWKQGRRAVVSPDRADHGIIYDDGARRRVDVVVPVMHGAYCEDGCLQGLLEMAGIPFVGPSVLASAVAMDKGMAKLVFASEGIPQADWVVVDGNNAESIAKIEGKFDYPVFVKPCNAGSSIGVSKAASRAELEAALVLAREHDKRILVEEFLTGSEVECAVLGNDDPITSCIGEIAPSSEFYDFDAKYVSGTSELTIPAVMDEKLSSKIQEYAKKAYKALGCRGLSRVDFFANKETGDIYLNEINTLPGFTSISMYPKLFEHEGIPCTQLIDRLIELGEQNG